MAETDASGPEDASGVMAGPAIPWLAAGMPPIGLTPCPEGWPAVAEEDGATTCDPFPDGGALDCGAGEAHFPGEPGCAPVGAPCPASSDFAEGLPADTRVVYVRPGAGAGDGTAASPYGSLMEFSLGGLPRDSVIALSRGDHDGPIRVTRGLTLWGACAAETTVSTTASSEAVIELLPGQSGGARDVTVAQSPALGVSAMGSGGEMRLDGIVIAGAEALGVFLGSGAHLVASSVVVRGTRPRSADRAFGRGVSVEDDSIELRRAVVEDNHDAGIFVAGPTSVLSLDDTVIRRTESQQSDLVSGIGVHVRVGATAVVARALIEGNRLAGVFVSDADTTTTLEDVISRETRGQALDGDHGGGLGVQAGAVVTASRVVLERNQADGASVFGSSLTMDDVVIRDTEPGNGDAGKGLIVLEGGAVALSRALLHRNRDASLQVVGAGSSLTLDDVAVRETEVAPWISSSVAACTRERAPWLRQAGCSSRTARRSVWGSRRPET